VYESPIGQHYKVLKFVFFFILTEKSYFWLETHLGGPGARGAGNLQVSVRQTRQLLFKIRRIGPHPKYHSHTHKLLL